MTVGPGLWFNADDGVVGRELWALALPMVTNDDGVGIVQPGQLVTYTIGVANPGSANMLGVLIEDAFPAVLQGVTWTCTAAGGAFCTPSGSGGISDVVDVPAGSRVTYRATGTLSPTAAGSLSNTATVMLQADPSRYSATDVDVVGSALGYFTLIPCRLVDTRGPGGPDRGPALHGKETRILTAPSSCGIPPTAKALSVNMAATGASAAGYPTGPSLPQVSTVNYSVGQTRSSNAVVSLNPMGQFSAYAGQPVGTTVDLIVDVTGYFE